MTSNAGCPWPQETCAPLLLLVFPASHSPPFSLADTASREGRDIDLLCCFCSHPKEKNFTHIVLAVSTPPPGAEWCSSFPCINFKHSVIIRPALPYMPGLYVPPAQPLPLSVPAVLVLMSRMPVSHYSSCAQEVFLQLACQNIPFSPFQSVLPALQNPAN